MKTKTPCATVIMFQNRGEGHYSDYQGRTFDRVLASLQRTYEPIHMGVIVEHAIDTEADVKTITITRVNSLKW